MLGLEPSKSMLREWELSEAFLPQRLSDNSSVCSPKFTSFWSKFTVTPTHRLIWVKNVSFQVSGYKLRLINPSAIAEHKVKEYAGSWFLFPPVLKPPLDCPRGETVEIMHIDPTVLFTTYEQI